jgi:hypothetical protein
MMRRTRVALLAVVTILVAGCGSESAGSDTTVLPSTATTWETADPLTPSTTTATTTTLETTTTLSQPASAGLVGFDGSALGFRMLVPEDWTAVTPSDLVSDTEFTEAMVEAVGEETAELVNAVFSSNGVLFAIDQIPRNGVSDNVNVIRSPSSGIGIEEAERLNREQMEALGAENIEAEIVTVPAGEALLFHYDLPQFGNQGISTTIFTDVAEWTITISYSDTVGLGFDPFEIINSFQVVG